MQFSGSQIPSLLLQRERLRFASELLEQGNKGLQGRNLILKNRFWENQNWSVWQQGFSGDVTPQVASYQADEKYRAFDFNTWWTKGALMGKGTLSLRAPTSAVGTTEVWLAVVCACTCCFQCQLAASLTHFRVPLALPTKKSAVQCEEHCRLLNACFMVGSTLPDPCEGNHLNSFSSRGMSPLRG